MTKKKDNQLGQLLRKRLKIFFGSRIQDELNWWHNHLFP